MGSGEEVRAKNGKEKVRKRVRFRGQQKGSTHCGDIISEVLKDTLLVQVFRQPKKFLLPI